MNNPIDYTSITTKALSLTGKWRRLSKVHLGFGASCLCSFGGTVDLSEFDDLILEYLYHKFENNNTLQRVLQPYLSSDQEYSNQLLKLLRWIASSPTILPLGQASLLLNTLEESLIAIETEPLQ